MIKHIIGCIAIMFVGVLLAGQSVLASEKFPPLEKPVFVQDHADIVSQKDKDEIVKKGQKLQDGTDADILVMTMKSIGHTPREDYAYEAGRHYKVGDQKHNRGIVILVNLDNGNENDNRGVQVAVGDGLEGVLNDAKVGELIDENFSPYAKKAVEADNKSESQKYYSEGITKLYNAIWNEIAKAYGYDGKHFKEKTPKETDHSGSNGFLGTFGTIFVIVIIILIIITRNGGGPPRGGGRRRDDSGMWWIGPGSGGFGNGSSDGGYNGGSFGGGGGFSGGGAGRGF